LPDRDSCPRDSRITPTDTGIFFDGSVPVTLKVVGGLAGAVDGTFDVGSGSGR
jgi:hypothetical protein